MPVLFPAAALMLLSCSRPEAPAEPSRPDVVLVVLDTQRRDRMGLYGHDRATSPVLDRLAERSIRYDAAYSQAPWTTPSIASLLASAHPSALGVDRYRSKLPDEAVLLQEVLGEAGYRTGAVVSHSYCGSRWGFDQGFDLFDESSIGGPTAVTSERVSDRAIRFVDRSSEPFFLLVHYFDPHFAYIRHEAHPWAEDAGYSGPIQSALPVRELRRITKEMSEADVEELLRIYDTEVAHTDEHLGRLLDHLDQRGRLDGAVVVVTADHGEEFLDHGRWGHTTRLYQELIHVPLVVHYPDGAAGVVADNVALVDVVPTVLAAVGLPPPPDLAGVDLRGPLDPERPVFAETSKGATLDAVVRGPHKLIRDRRTAAVELYDLGSDPAERVELSAEQPELVQALGEVLDQWRAQAVPQQPAPTLTLSEEERARLEALGYLDDH